MSLTLTELRQWPPEIADLATASRAVQANHLDSADFYRSLAAASNWHGDGGDAAKRAITATASDHDATAESLSAAVAGMQRAQHEAEVLADEIKSILDDAAHPPVVQINESSNQVIATNTDYLDESAAAKVAAKVSDLQARVAGVLSKGEQIDAYLASAIATASGVPAPPTKSASSLEDLMLGGAGGRKPPSSDDAAPTPNSLDSALNQLAGKPSDVSATPHSGETVAGSPAARAPMDPKSIEQFKNTARQIMQRDGVPADQIEQRLNAMVVAAQRPLTPYVTPKPESMPPPGFGEGFGDRWFSTEQGIKELLGQGGPGAPGVIESWRNLAMDTGERLTNPLGATVGDVKDALNSPSLAYYLGEKSADAAVAAPGLIFGGEGALLARGAALDALAGAGVPHQLVEAPAHHPLPMPDHSAELGGHGAPGGNPLPFDLDNPLPTARPEFTLSNPLDHMSPELRVLSEQNLTGSGETVLGPYAPVSGGPSYIQVAEDNGASYFDIGNAWNTSTPTQQLAANQHVLDVAVTNRDVIKLSVPFYEVRPDTFTGAEIRYIQKHGHQRIDDVTFVPPNIGGQP